MPGPLQVQHLPLQTNPSGLRGHRAVRSTLKTVQLSPSQQAFVDSLQGRLRREQAAEKQLADGTALSTAPCSIGGLSTEGERQAPVKLPNTEGGISAVHAEDRGDTAPTSEKRKVQPPEPTRKMLRTETERRDLSTAPSTVERSTEGERQPPEYMPTAVSQLTAAQTEDGGGDATASEPQPTSPLGSTRTMLRTETEHRDSSVSLEGTSDGQRASFG